MTNAWTILDVETFWTTFLFIYLQNQYLSYHRYHNLLIINAGIRHNSRKVLISPPCAADFSGNVGLLRLVNSSADLASLTKAGERQPLVVLLSRPQFSVSTLQQLEAMTADPEQGGWWDVGSIETARVAGLGR